MSAEIKKEIQLEIAHVLFIDIVGYSKLSINEQHAAVDELTQIVRATEQFQKAEAAGSFDQDRRPATGWRWCFTQARKRRFAARWKSAARSKNIRACNSGWASTAGRSAESLMLQVGPISPAPV